jgi:hypothetical protein
MSIDELDLWELIPVAVGGTLEILVMFPPMLPMILT